MWENVSHSVEKFQPLIKAEHLGIAQLILYGIVSQVFAAFGMATNIINIVCFVKLGFKEPINISLLGLAVSDFGSLLTAAWTNFWMVPEFEEKDLPFDPSDINYLVSGMPHIVVARITSCITAFITLERCLCISMPLKVASIFTSRRVSVVICTIFISLTISMSPIYYVGSYGMKYFPEKNKTIIGLTFEGNAGTVEMISFAINSVLVPFSSFFIALVCMTITVVKLNKQIKWRQEHAGVTKTDPTSSREQKVTKMVITISVLFVICFLPSVMIFMASIIEPEFWYNRRYHNMLAVSYGISTVFESANASTNIFIYYRMSTKYKTCFRNLFFSKENTNKI